MIDEARMIEIAQRFRKLEDAIEKAKPHIQFAYQRAEDELSELHREIDERDTISRWQGQELHRLTKIQESCDDLKCSLERFADACRDDMNEMQEEIRRLNG